MTVQTATPTVPVATPISINEVDFMKMVVKGLKGGTIIASFDATTNARLKKTGNPFSMPVMKTTRINGFIGYDYENSVNNQRVREHGADAEDFVAEKRQWGVRADRAFVLHKGRNYMTVKCERVLGEVQYHDAKGNLLKTDDVKPFLPKKSKSKTQGVEKEVIHRDYSLVSFDSITMNKRTFLIEH